MTTGIKAALEAVGGRDAVREAEDAREASAGTQLGLLDAVDRELDAKLPMQPPPTRRGPGRPPGARNKRTEANAAYMLGRYGDPLEGLMAMAAGDLRHTLAQLRALSAELGVPIQVEKVDGKLVACEPSLLGLLEFKRHCFEAVLPYLHAKRAPENDKGEAVVPILAFGTVAPGADARLAEGGSVSILDLVKVDPSIERYQALSDGEAEGSHGEGDGDGS